MWRPETNREKEAREKLKNTTNIAQPQSPQMTPEEVRQNNEELGLGWCNDLLKIVQYVVCCCGCCTSYDEYHDQ